MAQASLAQPNQTMQNLKLQCLKASYPLRGHKCLGQQEGHESKADDRQDQAEDSQSGNNSGQKHPATVHWSHFRGRDGSMGRHGGTLLALF